MKAEILKIAGVKSEKEFYKKYPTEEAFMKAHKKEFKKAAMGAKMVKTQLEQLTDFGNPPKAQVGTQLDIWGNPLPIVQMPLNPNAGVGQMGLNNAPGGTLNLAGNAGAVDLANQTQLWGTGQTISSGGALGGVTPGSIQGMGSEMLGKSNTNLIDKLGGYGAIGKTAGDLVGGFRKLKAEKEQRRKAQAWARVSNVAKQAQASMPKDIVKRQYLRPEDQMVQPDQLFPSYGVGTNYLAKDGTRVMKIGGNLTEIQNTYAPNTLYDNLGYEPLDESNKVKQFNVGGDLSKFSAAGGFDMLDTFGDLAIQNNAGGDIGGTIGGTAGGLIGTAVAGPVGKAIGEKIGKIGGKTIGKLIDTNPKRMKAAQEKTKSNIGAMAFGMGAQSMQQGQFSGFVKNGGNIPGYEEGGWVSHDWQPQVIATFGEHRMEDLLKADPMMDTLRTGGRITQNNMFPTDQYALGGELKTTWGGYAEPISYNPYMPGSGETVMFRGKSHEESDGRGHTGIGVKYGEGGKMTDYAEFGSRDADADVEVETGEPATEMIDGQTGEKNMVVFGNLKIPNMFLDQIGDVKAKGKKFKNYVADLGKMEAKQNNIIDKASKQIDGLDVYTPFDKLKMDALEAMTIGANMKLKEAALKKSNAAAVQNAINDTAAEHGIDADALAKGKIKIDKEAMKQQAKYGKEIMKAQTGTEYPYHPITNPTGYKDRLSFSQDVKDIVAPKDQPWYNATPRYQGKLSEPWDPKGTKNKKVYNEAFQNFKEQKQKGQKPFVPYSLNKNVAKIYDLALKDFNEQESAPVSRKIVKTSDVNTTTPVVETKKTSTTTPTVTKTKGKTSTKVVAPVVTKTPPAYQYSDSTSFLTDKTGRHIKIPIEALQEFNTPDQVPINQTATTTAGSTESKTSDSTKGKFDWINAINPILQQFIPTNQEAFDYSQVSPEMAALAMNQLEPVQAQLYRPDLGTPMDISLQDIINENQADFNATQRTMGYNPAAQAALSAMKYAANQKVLGEQFRLNQAEKQRVYEGNRALLNDAQLKNLGILDTQMVRQSEAKSRTKQQTLEAMKSVADKIAKNKLENRTLGIYENLYKYRFDPSGRAINMNPLAQFDYSGNVASKLPTAPEGYEYETVLKKKKKDEDTGRNGKIVKAIKNL